MFSGEHSIDHQMTEHLVVELKPEDAGGMQSLVPEGFNLEDEEVMMQLAIEMSLGTEGDPIPETRHFVNHSIAKLQLQRSLLSYLLKKFAHILDVGGKVAIAFMQVLLTLMRNANENRQLADQVLFSIDPLFEKFFSKPDILNKVNLCFFFFFEN